VVLLKKVLSLPAIVNKKPVAAFVNWTLPLADGRILRSNRGFAIFQNSKYPNKNEDILLDLVRNNGGTVTVMMECKITLNC